MGHSRMGHGLTYSTVHCTFAGPAAPAGFTAFPGHCVGPKPGHTDCTSTGDGWQIEGGVCADSDVGKCATSTSEKCLANPACHAFALHAGGKDCTKVGAKMMYKLVRLGVNSTVANSGWVSYARPGSAPRAPAHPDAGGSTIHRSADPAGPFLPVASEGYTGCNNPSPFVHQNGTLFLACTWSLHSAPRPEGPWRTVAALRPPSTNTRHWE
jgi:hypothetical protein